jgi:DNA-binding HxlR family transcriptional regulator
MTRPESSRLPWAAMVRTDRARTATTGGDHAGGDAGHAGSGSRASSGGHLGSGGHAGSGSGLAMQSSLEVALERVGDRWSLLLVEALLDGPRRFSDLLDGLPGLAPNILTDRLRRLERDGILVAAPYSRRPLRMEYALSADGRDLGGALRLLADWGSRRAAANEHEPLRHDRCGTPLEARWYCPTCAIAVDEREAPDTRMV